MAKALLGAAQYLLPQSSQYDLPSPCRRPPCKVAAQPYVNCIHFRLSFIYAVRLAVLVGAISDAVL